MSVSPSSRRSTDDLNIRHLTGASNKAFDYMAAGLALLVSDLPDWHAMFVAPGYALACDPADPASLKAALGWLLDHPEARRRHGCARPRQNRRGMELRYRVSAPFWRAERRRGFPGGNRRVAAIECDPLVYNSGSVIQWREISFRTAQIVMQAVDAGCALLFLDDCSTDELLEIAANCGFPDKSVLRNTRNIGLLRL